MSQDRHRQLKKLFIEACKLPDDERRQFVERVGEGDRDLRRELLELLAFHHAETTDSADRKSDRESLSASGSERRERFETGDVFVGRYRMLGLLGRGGMGEVYKAQDLILDQTVALKFLRYPDLPMMGPKIDRKAALNRPGGLRDDSEQLARLLNEVRLARQVTHPHVCRVFDFGQADDEIFLSMEYIDGEDLASLLARIGRFPQDKLIDLTLQLCDGLAAAHAQGILHRDLKPANVMIDGQGRVRITDFGLATYRPRAVEDSNQAAKTLPRGLAGTPAYMAPEQLRGEPATEKSDLYALGLILYEMATGHPAFTANSLAEIAALHDSQRPTPPSRHLSHFDPLIEAVILRCLEKDPADRPTSASRIAASLPGGARLDRALAAGETPSPELVAQAGTRRTLRPQRAAWLLAGLILALVALAGLSDLAFPGRRAWAEHPPSVLAAKAQEMLRRLGYDDKVQDRAWGFLYNEPSALNDAPGLFWYRQSPAWMVPIDASQVVSDARLSFRDPPMLEEGMARIVLNSKRRLISLHVIAPEPGSPEAEPEADALVEEQEAADDSSPTTDPMSWSSVLAMAGFSATDLEASEASFKPPVFADQRASWTTLDGTVRVSAASHDGKVVFFDLEPTAEEDPQIAFFDAIWDAYVLLGEVLWIALLLSALVLALRNWHRGRGDLPGAHRLAVFVFAIRTLHWLIIAHHVPDFVLQIERFAPALGIALLEAAGVWLAYIGLEPMVRRYWPQTLISWSRLLRRQPNDPLIGHSVLIGCCFGTAWALLTALDRLLARGLGLKGATELFDFWQLENAANTRMLIANVLTSTSEAILWGMLGLLALFGLRLLLGRLWLAALIFILINGVLGTLEGIHPAVSWLTVGLGISATTAWLLVRWGLLSYIVALLSFYLLTTSAISLDVRAWYCEPGALAALVIALLGFAGYRASRRTSATSAIPP